MEHLIIENICNEILAAWAFNVTSHAVYVDKVNVQFVKDELTKRGYGHFRVCADN